MGNTLTVAIANYNHGHFLERCITAVMTQEKVPDEIIIYDDCSTDNSLEIIHGIQTRWPQIRLIQGQRNVGVIAVINSLAQIASGDWLHLLAADDTVLPGFYRLAIQAAQKHPNSGAIFGSFIGVEEETGERWMESADRWIDAGFCAPEEMLWKLFHKAPAMFGLGFTYIWRRQAFLEEEGFIPELKMYDELIFRNVTLRYGAVYLGTAPLSCVRSSFETYSGNARKNKEMYAAVLDKAAQLMRTKYADIYPERFVRHWQKKYREELGFTPMSKVRWLKLAIAWSLRKIGQWITRWLGR